MDSIQKIISKSSVDMSEIKDKSIELVITSPPYPMIEMWNDCFSMQDNMINQSLENHNYLDAFNRMHMLLDRTWKEVDRVLIDGGIVCINIGDATKNCDDIFQLFSNHSKIISSFVNMGYCVLPDIHWRKRSNSPNKFMGSGMYPPGAYVTYEHEYILIFRKGPKREFKNNNDKYRRHESSYFWEERNIWFSDLWEIKGKSQIIKDSKSRNRSAAFPFELAYRLVNMFSIKYDTVLDPFAGIGTVSIASMASQRNSIGFEIDENIANIAISSLYNSKEFINKYIDERLKSHQIFIQLQRSIGKDKFYMNIPHDFEVKTKQEIQANIKLISLIKEENNNIICSYN